MLVSSHLALPMCPMGGLRQRSGSWRSASGSRYVRAGAMPGNGRVATCAREDMRPCAVLVLQCMSDGCR